MFAHVYLYPSEVNLRCNFETFSFPTILKIALLSLSKMKSWITPAIVCIASKSAWMIQFKSYRKMCACWVYSDKITVHAVNFLEIGCPQQKFWKSDARNKSYGLQLKLSYKTGLIWTKKTTTNKSINRFMAAYIACMRAQTTTTNYHHAYRRNWIIGACPIINVSLF